MALCQVTVYDATGAPWTLEVEAASLYSAIFAYNAEQVAGSNREYPRLEPDTEIHVRLTDGLTYRTTFGTAQRWANRRIR